MLPTDPNALRRKSTPEQDFKMQTQKSFAKKLSINVNVLLINVLHDQIELLTFTLRRAIITAKTLYWDKSGSFVMIFLHHMRAAATA